MLPAKEVNEGRKGDLLFLTPLILLANLFLLSRGKVILDIERLTNLLRSLAFDHVSHCFASDVQQTFDI